MLKKSKSIKIQFLSSTILIIFVTLLFVGTLVSYEVYEKAKVEYLNNSKEQMEIVDSSINIFYNQINKDINMMATNPLVMKANSSISNYKNTTDRTKTNSSKVGGLEQELYELFKHYADNHEGVEFVYLGIEDGSYIQWPEI